MLDFAFGARPVPISGKGESWMDPQHLPLARHGQMTVATRIWYICGGL